MPKGGTDVERLILASRSPRRCELLGRFGIPFETYSPDVDETCGLPAGDAVALLSLRKARAAASGNPGAFILAADTLVSLEGVSLGKPSSPDDAMDMLRHLSGNTHQVYTGITVMNPSGETFTETDCTDVTFTSVSEEEIRAYVATGEPMDKAGAYALQGRAGIWVRCLKGSDSSVIGLPLCLTRKLLLKAGYPLISGCMKESI